MPGRHVSQEEVMLLEIVISEIVKHSAVLPGLEDPGWTLKRC